MSARILTTLGIVLSLAVGVVVAPAAADTRPPRIRNNIMIVMDTSGSMAETDGTGQSRIEGAKAGAIALVDSLPSNTNIGFMTYPQTDTECGEPRLVYSISPLKSHEFTNGISAVGPAQGGTPTALALQKAGKLMEDTGEEGTIVLVSDGENTCEPDPCEVAKELVAKGQQLTVNTVGFAISSSGEEQLRCIAEATGGTYTAVDDVEQLGKQLADSLQPSPTMELSVAPVVDVASRNARVTATITNNSSVAAADAQVALTVSTDDREFVAVLRPVIALGNLGKNTTRTVAWDVPVDPSLSGSELTAAARLSFYPGSQITATATYTIGFGGADVHTAFDGMKKALVLGDSFSAGDGVFTDLDQYGPEGSEDRECRRGPNYAKRIFEDVTNLACTGATTSDIPKQLSQLRQKLKDGERYDVVFISIGGNDSDFEGIATMCAMSNMFASLCKYGGDLVPSVTQACGIHRTTRLVTGGDAVCPLLRPFHDWKGSLDNISANVQDAYVQVAREFNAQDLPSPPIVAVPYPLMFPLEPRQEGRCADQEGTLDPPTMRAYKEAQLHLNGVVKGAVERAQAEGVPVHYAAPVQFAVQPSHTICGQQPWIQPLGANNIIPNWLHDAFVSYEQQRNNMPERLRWMFFERTTELKTWNSPLHPTLQGQIAMSVQMRRWAAREGFRLEPQTDDQIRRGKAPWIAELSVVRNLFELTRPGGSIKLPNSAPSSPISLGHGETELVVEGASPGTPVSAWITSTPQLLGVAEADEDGVARIRVRLNPNVVHSGEHTLHVQKATSDKWPVVDSYPVRVSHPVPLLAWLLMGISGLILAGLMIQVVTRSRQRRKR